MALVRTFREQTEEDTVPANLFTSPADGMRHRPLSIVERAQQILAAHSEVPDGFCLGCMNEFGFAVPHPCSQAHWATRTIQLAESEPQSERPSWDEDTREVEALRARDREISAATGWNQSTRMVRQVLGGLQNLNAERG